MSKYFTAIAVTMLSLTAAAWAAPAKTKSSAKVVDVKVCPMTNAPMHGKGAGSRVVGNYRVHFCCGGCPEAFNKLSKAEQKKKVAAAVKTQNSRKAS